MRLLNLLSPAELSRSFAQVLAVLAIAASPGMPHHSPGVPGMPGATIRAASAAHGRADTPGALILWGGIAPRGYSP